MKDLSSTQFFQVESGPQIQAKDILEIVYKALKEKGYNPVNQMVGYIMSGDPTYYYVRGSDLYHQPQRRQKSDHEDGAGRTGGRDAENVY